jgi:cyanosortase A-associated protein
MIVMWKKVRIPTLVLTCGGVLFVLGNVILRPVSDLAANSKLIFAEKISLPQWQQVSIQPLPKLNREEKNVILQSRYQYTQNGSKLDIEMRYVAGGNLPALLRQDLKVTSKPVIRQQKNVGFYAVGTHKKRVYLSACIAPNAQTTFTEEQLKMNVPEEKNSQYWASWLVGKESIPTKRCLWTHLSIPLGDSDPETAYTALENIWSSWYQLWLPQVPNI